jgi:hypothetical protein
MVRSVVEERFGDNHIPFLGVLDIEDNKGHVWQEGVSDP